MRRSLFLLVDASTARTPNFRQRQSIVTLALFSSTAIDRHCNLSEEVRQSAHPNKMSCHHLLTEPSYADKPSSYNLERL